MRKRTKSITVIRKRRKAQLIAGGTAAAMMFASTLAGAVTFDFASLANGNENSYTTFTYSEGSITVNASGQSADGTQDYYAYMDSGNAGLGVCEALTASGRCSPSSDDNVTFDELLRLDFNQPVSLSDITFINGNHGNTFDGVFELSVDGGPATTYNLTSNFSMNLTGTTFDFINPNIQGGSNVSNGYQFYIGSATVTAVPVPAAGWLFVSGMLGLAGLSRRKVRAQPTLTGPA
ncbi:MAG: hypothetical protein BMS9Abin06_0803 [Gammaproteobacteria bacterium]|nr:MAG: hypothetical protein BMS9Abin06_0803 [Gammaproteobacteria bacterium]